MTYQEKFIELSNDYNIDENCIVIKNESEEQVVFEITDEEENYIMFDFDLINQTYRTIIQPIDEDLYEEDIQDF